MNSDEDQNQINYSQLKEMKVLFTGFKITHTIFVVIFVSVFIGMIENPAEVGLTVELILLLVCYVLCGGSLLLLVQVYQKIS